MRERAGGGRVSGSWRALLFLPLTAVLLFFSFPTAQRQRIGLLVHLQRTPEQRFAARTSGFGPLIREVERRVPPDQPILIQAPRGASPLHWDHVINYWLYPRKIYSVDALRLAGEDVRRFVRTHGIRWRYRGGKLESLGGPVPPPQHEQLARSLHSGSTARVATGILLALIHFLSVGACIVGGVDRRRLVFSRIERFALSYLLGTGAVGSWAVLCFATGIGVRLSTVLFSLPLALVCFALARFLAGRRSAPSSRSRGEASDAGGPSGCSSRVLSLTPAGRGDGIAAMVALVLVGVLTFRALAMPMGGYDSRYQWAYKAHVMLHEDSIWDGGFQDPDLLQAHPRYPLLIPGVETVVFLYAGGFNDQYVTLLFPLFLGALLVVLYCGLARLGRQRGRGLAVLALLLVPGYWGYGIARDGAAAFSGYPDLPLSAFAGAAMIYLLRARHAHQSGHLYLFSALLMLFCGLAKAEGKVHFLVFLVLALAPLAFDADSRSRLRSAAAAFGGVAFLLALYELAVVHPTRVGLIPDDYSQLLSWGNVVADLGRLPEIFRMFSKDFFLSPRFGFAGLVLAAALLFSRGGPGRQALLPVCYVVLLLASFSVPYLVLPEEIWTKNYTWSAGRLMLQLVPMTFLAVAILVLPPSVSRPGLARRAGDE